MATPPDYRNTSDEDLARHAHAEREAFRELHRRYHLHLIKRLRILFHPGEIEDIAQDTWVKVFHALKGDFSPRSFRGWLFSLARNAANDWLRKHHPTVLPEDFDVDDGRFAHVKQLKLQEEITDLLKTWIEQLPPDNKKVVKARLAGKSAEEIAGFAGVDQNRVYQLFFDAKAKLTKCPGDHG